MIALPLLLVFVSPALGALVEPYAGGSIGDGRPALEAPLTPEGVAADAAGNVYVTDRVSARVRRIDAATGLISTVVGSERGWCGYEGPGTDLCLSTPAGLSVGADGDVWVTGYGSTFRWDASTGLVTHVAGRHQDDPEDCVPGDSVPAVAACLSGSDVVVDDASGDVFVLDIVGRRVVRVSGGVATHYAGCALQNDTVSGEGGPASAACLGHNGGLDVDAGGNLFLASSTTPGRIWRIDAASGLLTRVAGGGTAPACFEDDVPATAACISPHDVTVAAGGALFFSSRAGQGLRRLDAGTQELMPVGAGLGGFIDAAADGFLYTTGPNTVLRVDPSTGDATVIAGNGWSQFCGEGVPATDACLSSVLDIATTGDGTLFLADPHDGMRIRRVDPETGIITTVATGRYCQEPRPAEPAEVCFNDRVLLAATPGGELFVGDEHGDEDEGVRQLIRRLDPTTGALTTVAGRCNRFAPGGIPALDACLDVRDLAADAAGNLFLAERGRVRRIDAQSGEISVVAGSGTFPCAPGDDPAGPALETCLEAERLTVAPDGTLYVVSAAGFRNAVVLRHDAASATLQRVAGRPDAGCARVSDGAPATAGCLRIESLAVDAAGNLLVGDGGMVRLIEAGSRRVTTLAGRVPDPSGFDPCCEACTNPPECLRATDLAFDAAGRLFTAEPEKHQVRRITLTCGDGVVGEGETCDDGNRVSGDGCDASCVPSRCPGAAVAPAACDGQRVPRAIMRVFERRCALEARLLDVVTPRQLRGIERSMARTLRQASRHIERTARRGWIGTGCAEALRAALD